MENFFKLTLLTSLFLFKGFEVQANIDSQSNPNQLLSPTDNGGIGLIQNPTARFNKDGTITFGISSASPYNRLYATMQFFPWLETTIKYTETTNRLYGPERLSGDQTWKDKSADIKIRLFKESNFFPEVAIGFYDFGGNSRFGSEYLVANKRIKNFDFSLGLGWGSLSHRDVFDNPLTWIADQFENRSDDSGEGGRPNLGALFSGQKVGVFGGVAYQTPIENLTIKLEYDSNDYQNEPFDNKFKVDSPFNFGINYRILNQADLSLGLERGNTAFFNVSIARDLNKKNDLSKYKPPKEQLLPGFESPFPLMSEDDRKQLVDLILWQMGNEGIVTDSIIFNGNEIIANISQGRFRETTHAIDLASRILANNAPNNMEIITVANIEFGLETYRSSIRREDLVEIIAKGALTSDWLQSTESQLLTPKFVNYDNEYLYPSYNWQITPNVRASIGGPDAFYLWKLEAILTGQIFFKRGLYLTTKIAINIDNNLDKFRYEPTTGTLHHVRSDIKDYWTQGEDNIARMELDYLFEINSNIIGRISGGLFEEMYGGFGGEALYVPDNGSWALGIDAHWVKQRDYNVMFDFRDYETITGHLTLYYDLPFYDLRLKTSVGKYLAKDKGATIDLSRKFNNGTRVGAKAAFTNVSSEDYGEGSFSKWIYVTVPMDLFVRSSSRKYTTVEWSPLTRDGGQKLNTHINLFSMVTNAPDEITYEKPKKKSWSLRKILSGFNTGSSLQ